MRPQGNVKFQVWLLIGLVFALGGVTGAAIERLFLHSPTERFEPARRGGGRGGGGMIKRMKEDLKLTEEQEKTIQSIFEDSRKQFKMDDCPGFKEARQRTQTRIREVLTPDQQKRYDEINAQREAEMNRPKS
ncbi:MAG: Spy/CpxP family protein refolding chaperone [Blastocatellia bacterium]|nr:Spy/CpxP family protein refolding chaperone [Blastocatellia bacterium]